MLANLVVAVVVLAFAALGWYVLEHLDSAMFPDEGSPRSGRPQHLTRLRRGDDR